MQKLYVIRKEDLSAFGCPICGEMDICPFISLDSCSICECQGCCCQCATVSASLDELFQIKMKNTEVVSFVDGHPFSRGSDSMIVTQSFSTLPPAIGMN